MWWRANVILWTILSIGIAVGITTILVTLMLLPSITDGPDNIHYLERTRCTVTNITYVQNYCPRDTSNDFSNLVYRNDWPECLIIMVNSTTEIGANCSWFFPGSFDNEEDAYIGISDKYKPDKEYDCVLDTIKNICYPDKDEVLIFSLSVVTLSLITGLIILLFCYLKVYWSRKREKGLL